MEYNTKFIKSHSRKIISYAEEFFKEIDSLDESPKRKEIEGITIDGEGTRVRDDLVWVEKNKNGYSVFVSIIDTSEKIKKDSLLYLEAKKRVSSFYLSTHSIQMFPEILSLDKLSINNNEYRLTQTTRIDLDNDFNVINSEIFESKSYNKKAYTYKEFEDDYNNIESNNFKQFKLMGDIAIGLKNKREGIGTKNFNECITLNLNKGCNKTIENIGQIIISEFAILKKIEDAKIAYKEKIDLLFKGFSPHNQGAFIGNIDKSKSFFSYKPVYHSGFGTSFVSSTTSPTRLYSDLVNQYQQKQYLRKEKPLYSLNEIRKIAIEINNKYEKIMNFQKEYNKEIFLKRVKRFIRKLKENNFEYLSSVPSNIFFNLIKYFSFYKPEYFCNEKIISEILFRIDNNLLSDKELGILNSISNEFNQANIIKERIKDKTHNFQSKIYY